MADRVAIVGARAASPETLAAVREYVRSLPPGTVVISGGAEGVDAVAAEEARSVGLTARVFRPHPEWVGSIELCEWASCFAPVARRIDVSRQASKRDLLFLRNSMIVVDCTRLVAFPDGSKGGTWDAIKQAARFRRPVEERYADGRVVTRGGR